MKKTDTKLYKAFLLLLRTKGKISVSNLSRTAGVDRTSVYHRLNNLDIS
jgi:predicted transcriptional regulator